MKEAMLQNKFGSLTQISEPNFVKEVTEASKEVWVVLLLFKDG